jgi:F-type H+-transporting ATPase subunit b
MTVPTTIVRVGLLALLAASITCAAGSLRAQEQPAQPPKQQSGDSAKPSRALESSWRMKARSGGRRKRRQSSSSKQSPSVQFIARHTGLSTGNAYFLSVLLNFAVIAGVIFWAGRKYLPAAFSARTAAIQKAMQEAQKASDEARRRLAEIESRLMKLDVEIGMMRDTAEKRS